jgi:hypothetical protein
LIKGHLVRVLTMDVVTVLFLLAVVDSTRRSMRRDPSARDRAARRESLGRARRGPWLSARVRARIRDYNRRDFHPDDHETDQMLDEWRASLFGPAGTLAGRLGDQAAQMIAI